MNEDDAIARIRSATLDRIVQVRDRAAQRAQAREKLAELRTALEVEYGMTNHPKRHLVWDKARLHGESSDVRFWYGEFAEVAA